MLPTKKGWYGGKMIYGNASLNIWVLSDVLKVCSGLEVLMGCVREFQRFGTAAPKVLLLFFPSVPDPGDAVRHESGPDELPSCLRCQVDQYVVFGESPSAFVRISFTYGRMNI